MAYRARDATAGDRCVTGRVERGIGDVRRTELEAAAARSHVARRVAARAVAVEAGERDVIARIGEDREYGVGGNAECPGVGAVAAQAVRHTLVRAGRGVLRGVAGRCVAR